jgi:hypothetical protein
MDESAKNKVDLLVAGVLSLVFARPMLLFLVVPAVSKMLLTLVAMLIDVGPFSMLMFCYLFAATQLFSTLYQDINS